MNTVPENLENSGRSGRIRRFRLLVGDSLATRSSKTLVILAFALGMAAVIGGKYIINRTTVADFAVSGLLTADTPGTAEVIVVPGAGVTAACTPNLNSLHRAILAAKLLDEGRGSFVLFAGGRPRGLKCSVAEVMAALAERLGVPRSRILIEAASRSTWENAAFSAPILNARGVHHILVVTDRLHMKRAEASFAAFGFRIERAAVPIYDGLPDNVSMLRLGLREYAALAYYRYRGYIGSGRHAPLVAVQKDSSSVSSPPRSARTGSGEPMTSIGEPSRPVVILGASYAAGWDLKEAAGISIINAGIAGQQSFELLARFERDVLAKKPRAVLIWGFINDVFRSPRDKIDQTLELTRDSFTKMIAVARAHGIEVIVATEITVGYKDSWLEAVAGIVGSLMGKESYQQYVNGHVRRTNDWLRDLAKGEGLLLLELDKVLSDAEGDRRKEFATPDGSHISPAGYAALTKYSVPILARHLQAQ